MHFHVCSVFWLYKNNFLLWNAVLFIFCKCRGADFCVKKRKKVKMEGRYIFMGVIIWNAVFVNLISTGHQDVMKWLLQCLFKCTSFIIINLTFQKQIFLYSYDFLHIMGKNICWGWDNMQQKSYKKSNVQLVDRKQNHSKIYLHHILSSWYTIYPKMVDSLSWQLIGENSVSTGTPRWDIFDSL